MLRHLCQSVESHVEPLFCYIFSLFFSAVENRAAQCSTACKWIVYHNRVHNVICVFPFCVMFLFMFFCVFLFLFFFADDLSYMGSSETLVSIQYAFHRTVVVVLLLSVVPGTSNSKKTWLWLAQYRASIWSSCTLPCYLQLYKAGDKCAQEFFSISL